MEKRQIFPLIIFICIDPQIKKLYIKRKQSMMMSRLFLTPPRPPKQGQNYNISKDPRALNGNVSLQQLIGSLRVWSF